jgi:hypothetical protein
MTQSLSANSITIQVNDCILSDLDKRIEFSEAQLTEYSNEISEMQLQIEELQTKIEDSKYWLKIEENRNLHLKYKHITLSKQFSEE